MEPTSPSTPVLVARRVPKRARKVPKATPVETKGAENLLTLVIFVSALLLVQFVGVVAGLLVMIVCGVLLIRRYVTRRARVKTK